MTRDVQEKLDTGRPAIGSTFAPVTAIVAGRKNRKVGPTPDASKSAAAGSLPTRRFATAAENQSATPPGGMPKRSYPGRPASWTEVWRPGSRISITDRHESNAVARLEPGGRIQIRVKKNQVGATDEAPAARAVDRVDARLAPGDGHRARPDPRPRRCFTRDGQSLMELAAICEPRREANAINEIVAAGM